MIRVNDEPVAWRGGMTVRQVLRACNYLFPLVIVTIDGTLVSRDDFDTTAVPDEAAVKVIHLTSGG
jgi:sulfur carrier protein